MAASFDWPDLHERMFQYCRCGLFPHLDPKTNPCDTCVEVSAELLAAATGMSTEILIRGTGRDL